MTLFTQTKPNDQSQKYLDNLSNAVTLCQLHDIKIYLSPLYNNGVKQSAIILDGVEIKENVEKPLEASGN